MITSEQVLDALAGVRDPELDEPLTDLGFVEQVTVEGDAVAVSLRLPTYFCAPNFAFLMADDARAAVVALDGVGEVRVVLEDHFASPEINTAVHNEQGFRGAFPDETEGGLASLRTLFHRKAFTARQGSMCERVLATGLQLHELAAMRLADLAHDPDHARCVELRRALGLAAADDSPAFLLGDGSPLDPAGLDRYLRISRLMRVSLEGNAGLCRSLLKTRYGDQAPRDARHAIADADNVSATVPASTR
jgi:metal-sulfur cluster biosynthetic enzyme